jgi:putative tributyrin esterase
MTKYLRASLVVVVLALILSTRSAGVPPAAQATTNFFSTQSLQTSTTRNSNRVQTIQFESKLVGETLPYNVLLPVNYNQPDSKTKRYPVVYLLHGLMGHYNNWLDKTRIADYAAAYDFIIVMPEGNDRWYTDSATAPAEKYESYILDELLPDVEKRFRVSAERDSRAIAGLSMGGYGAIKFGLKHPEMFALAASFSGAFNAASWTEREIKEPGVIRDSVMRAFGSANSETRAKNDVAKLAREAAEKKLSLPYLYVDCGTEDFLFSDNREFVNLLAELKIPHEYRQLPGTHSWTTGMRKSRKCSELLQRSLLKRPLCRVQRLRD